MKRPVVCVLLLSSLLSVLQRTMTMRSTQEELRRRNVYFGDIDGRSSGELEQALKRYQRRKGPGG